MTDAIDPRYDPQFQRGYDPGVHAPRSRPAEAARREPEPVNPPPPAPEALPDRPVPADAPPAAAAPAETADPAQDEADAPRRRFPFRLVLLLASIASIAAAAWLLWTRVNADPLERYYGSDPELLFREQFVEALLIPLLVAGFVGILLWLAIGAVRRRDDA